MTPVFKWEKQTGRHQLGEWLSVGKIVVGSAFYSGTKSRDDPRKYAVSITLPGIKNPEQHYETLDEAKARLERAVATWFKWAQEP